MAARSIFYTIIFLKTVFFAGAALCALAAAPAWAQGPVSGTVVSHQPGQPPTAREELPGATVFLDGQAVGQTNSQGYFQLKTVAVGVHQLRVSSLGHTAYEDTISGRTGLQQRFVTLQASATVTPEALITASRASDRTATAYTNLSREDLAKRNFGQDLPYLLDQTPSVVVNSDAGAGAVDRNAEGS